LSGVVFSHIGLCTFAPDPFRLDRQRPESGRAKPFLQVQAAAQTALMNVHSKGNNGLDADVT
jgi:hypothetical protein